ncbi:MAG: GNAT family N-acetyltransferase [Oscillospiraceae bacterium]|nr:GNAT family N-acetyltransferase [Oscillospiraceae bacterium]
MKLAPIFASHMVLAAGKPIRVFGTGRGEVTVSLAGTSRTAFSEGENWLVELPAMEEGGPYEMTVCMNGENLLLEDVRLGEVWLFAGQSNMQFKLRESVLPAEERQSEPRLRLFSTERFDHRPARQDRFRPADGWVTCTAENAGDWSAIAYHAGLIMTARKNIAVGAVSCYQGASVIDSWVPAGTFDDFRVPPEERHKDHTHEDFSRWNGEGFLYENGFKQVVPFSFTGVAWYQGESNASPAEGKVYDRMLCALIDRWREDLGDSELPFVIVQLADFTERAGEGWSLVQQAQLALPAMRKAVRTVVCADVCEDDDIHPPTKAPLSGRIAAAAAELTGGVFAEEDGIPPADAAASANAVALRRLRPDDMEHLTRWLQDDRVTRWAWAEGVPWDLGKVTEEFADVTGTDGTLGCMVLYRGEPAGYLQFYPLEGDSYKAGPEVIETLRGGYGIDFFIGLPELWDKGIGSRVIGLAAEYLRGQGVKLLTADPALDNPRSLHFWQKNGFVPLCEVEDYDDPGKKGLLCVKKL